MKYFLKNRAIFFINNSFASFFFIGCTAFLWILTIDVCWARMEETVTHCPKQAMATTWIKNTEAALQKETPELWAKYVALSEKEKCGMLQHFHRCDPDLLQERNEKGTGDYFSEMHILKVKGALSC